ncbi:MAG TPA: methyl-accepting chemotaxis protein, partial [Actinomycetales bacterium]
MTQNDTARRRSPGDLPVGVKILAAILTALVVAGVVGLVGIKALGGSAAAADTIYSSNVQHAFALADMRVYMRQTRLDVANHAISQDKAGQDKYAQKITEDIAAFDKAYASYASAGPAGNAQDLATLDEAWRGYLKVVDEHLLPASEANDIARFQTDRDKLSSPLADAMTTSLTALGASEKADALQNNNAAAQGYTSSRTQVVIVLVVGFVLALGLGVLVSRAIVRSLGRVQEVCDGLATGDLTRTAGLTSRDEVGQMGTALDTAVTNLRATVGTIDGSATSLAGAAEEMTSVS